MRRFCWLVVFSVGVLLLPSASAEAAWVSCPGTSATDDREFKLNTTPGSSCLPDGSGSGNLSGNGDAINDLGWITLDKSDDSTTGALQGALQITGQGSTNGTFTITNPLAWATYSQLVIAFKTGQGQENPDWAAFILPTNVTSGTWKVTGKQALSHANLYGRIGTTTPPDPLPAVPEPATLALISTGLGWLGVRRVKRRRADVC